MMRLGLSTRSSMHSLSSVFTSARAAHTSSANKKEKEETGNITTEVAQRSIENYSNIFTKEGDKVFIHAHVSPGKPAEKRMTFVKLYMYANHLIGNRSIPLLCLTTLCKKEGYKSNPQKNKKSHHIRSDNFKTLLTSNTAKKLFQLFGDEEGKKQVRLTDEGIKQIQDLACIINSLDPEEPRRRVKDVVTIFKKEEFLNDGNPVSRKKLRMSCESHGYFVRSDNLKVLLSGNLARQLFIFDRDRDRVRLSPAGLITAQSLK